MKSDAALALISALLGLAGQLAWRYAIPKDTRLSFESLLKLLSNKFVILGFSLYALSTLAWLAALSKGELSKLYPLISVNYALALVAGHLLFGEPLTLAKILGVMLIIGGVALIAASH
ncbi:MAG: EamA family transporter [Thermofilaceae archaeon]